MPWDKSKQPPSEKSQAVLFNEPKAKENPKFPTLRGNVTIHRNDLKWMVEQVKAGKEAKLRISLWKRMPKNGGAAFLSGELDPDEYDGKKKGDDFGLELDDSPSAEFTL